MEYLKNTWYFAAWSEEVVEGEMFARTMNGLPILLLRDPSGKSTAMDDLCPHRFAPLSMGKLVDGKVVCAYHGLEFGMDGKCVHNPHPSGKIPKKADVRAYPTHERHSAIWMWMGDPDRADPSLIPDFGKLDPDQLGANVTRRDHFVMKVPYELIIDNLVDISHICFVHEGILGTTEMIKTPTEIHQEGNTFHVTRYAKDGPPSGMFDMIYRQDGENVDFWTDFRWDAPSCMLLDVGVCPPGGNREDGTGYFAIHCLTPETENTTHYFTAVCRWNISPGSESDEMRIKIADMRRYAFQEQDEPLIMAQHKMMQMFAPEDLDPVFLEVDVGIVRWRRIIEKMREAD